MGGALPDWSRSKATLPIRLGGVGLRQACDHSASIFLASVFACSSLIMEISDQVVPPSYTSSAFQLFGQCSGLSDISSFSSFDFPISQKSLSRAVDQFNFDHLLDSSINLRPRALLLSSSLPHAGDWLTVLPSNNLGLHLLDSEFRLCLRYWLGVPLASDFFPCPICSRPADPSGDHALACGGNGDRSVRHNALRDVIFSVAQSAALSPRREVPSLLPDSISRPADVYLPVWSHGRPAAVDVTVISPLQCQVLPQAASIQGHALTVANARKRRVHFDNCRSVGVDFLPLAVESLGGWSEDALSFLLSLSRNLASRHGLPPSEVSQQLLQRLSITIWRFNAQMWLSRFPVLPPPVDGVV